MPDAKSEKTARERLLDAADELFYAEGVHTVGIDRVIEHAGVAKASLYSSFGSKEELVRAYLERRAERRRTRILAHIAHHDNPRDKVLSVFDLLGELVKDPGYRGCAFINATAEGNRSGKPRSVCVDQRSWIRGLFTALAREAGVPEPETMGQRLQLLYDGAATGCGMEHDPSIVAGAKAIAEILLPAKVTSDKHPSRR
jgi:AcrR family transcriptional regulator